MVVELHKRGFFVPGSLLLWIGLGKSINSVQAEKWDLWLLVRLKKGGLVVSG